MPDASDKIRGFFEKVIRIVPGYAGYADKESRRDTDKIVRMHLAGQLQEVKAAFDHFTADLTRKPGCLELLTPANSIAKLLEKLIDRLKFADYGYAGFFDQDKIQEPQLDAMYQFDLALSQAVMDFQNKVKVLQPDADILKALLSDLQAFDQRLNERHGAITGDKAV